LSTARDRSRHTAGAWRIWNSEDLHNVFLPHYYYGVSIKVGKNGETCSNIKKKTNAYRILVRKPKKEEFTWEN
jgi:hypothetical protein